MGDGLALRWSRIRRGAPRTMSRVPATSGSTSKPGSSCAPRVRRSMSRVSPSRSSPPRSRRSHSASSRDRCSNRRRASPAFRRRSTTHTSARGISRNDLAPGISDCPTTGRRRLRRHADPRPLGTPRLPRQSDCAVPSSDPGEPIGPLAWSPESLKEDWPAPVRPEVAGGRSVQPMPLTHLDPTGDTGSGDFPASTSAA